MIFNRPKGFSFIAIASVAGVALGWWIFQRLGGDMDQRHDSCNRLIEQLSWRDKPIERAIAALAIDNAQGGGLKLNTRDLSTGYWKLRKDISRRSLYQDRDVRHAAAGLEQAFGNYQDAIDKLDGSFGSSLQLAAARDGVAQNLEQVRHLCSTPASAK